MKMLIVFLVISFLANISTVPTCKKGKSTDTPTLATYDVAKDKSKVKKMYCSLKDEMKKLGNADSAMKKLEKEAGSDKKSDYYDDLEDMKKTSIPCPAGMFQAECLAVKMYTSCMYETLNEELRDGNLKKFKIFVTLLQSAIEKLKVNLPKTPFTIYRGVSRIYEMPSKPFFFKQFTSTSLSEQAAKRFSKTQKLHKYTIETPSLIADISSLSGMPHEHEALVSLFQAFEFVNQDGYFNFKSINEDFKC